MIFVSMFGILLILMGIIVCRNFFVVIIMVALELILLVPQQQVHKRFLFVRQSYHVLTFLNPFQVD